MDDPTVRAKIDMIKEFIRACEAKGFDPVGVIASHRESDDRNMTDTHESVGDREKRAVTLSTDFGDIRIVPNPFVAHDQLVVTHNDKPLAAVRINAPN